MDQIFFEEMLSDIFADPLPPPFLFTLLQSAYWVGRS
jgi:hypothetical protein